MFRPFAFTFAIALSLSMPLSMNAQSISWTSAGIRFVLPTPPRTNPPGGRSRGGASRSNCQNMTPPLTALVPTSTSTQSSEEMNVWGLTTADYPTIWIYVPYQNQQSNDLTKFVLQDEESNLIYEKMISLPAKSGVIGIQLPTSLAPLQVGKRYRWFFNVYCQPQQTQTPIYVEGVLERVKLEAAVTKQIEAAPPQQQVSLYAANGIWYETLTVLAQARQRDPQNAVLNQTWTDLLQSIGLNDVAGAEILK